MTTATVDTTMDVHFPRSCLSRKKSSVRRNLFGVKPTDHAEVNSFLKAELDKMQAEHTSKWNFDFKTDCPLDGNYQWEPVVGYVPKIYQAKVVVSSIPNRTEGREHDENRTNNTLRTAASVANSVNCAQCTGQQCIRPNPADENCTRSNEPSEVQAKNDTISTPKTPRSTCSNVTRGSATLKTTKPCYNQRKIPDYMKQRKRRLQMDGARGEASKVAKQRTSQFEEQVLSS
ncbi:uncharacterized protein LOC144452878 [Glandiceps talaboti]